MKDKFFEENYEKIQESIFELRQCFQWRKNNNWKWVSYRGLMALLDKTENFEKRLLQAALIWLEVKTKITTKGGYNSIFYLMPEPAEWLHPKVEELRKLFNFRINHCIVCGVEIDLKHKYCAECSKNKRRKKTKDA